MKRSLKQKIILWIVPFLGYLLICILFLLCRHRYFITSHLPSESTPIIVAFWHGELLMQPLLYRRIRKKKQGGRVMISDHFDGEIISRIISYFGLLSLRGSTYKGNKKVLLQAIKTLRENNDIAITPDGPRGPRHEVAQGIIAISQKTEVPIIAFRTECSAFWNLKSWDRFMIPKPFCTINHYIYAPFSTQNLTQIQAQEKLQSIMTQTPSEIFKELELQNQ